MNDDLKLILLDQNVLVDGLANVLQQVLMLGAESLPQPEKDKRLRILESLQIVQDGAKKTCDRIKAAHAVGE